VLALEPKTPCLGRPVKPALSEIEEVDIDRPRMTVVARLEPPTRDDAPAIEWLQLRRFGPAADESRSSSIASGS